MIKSLATGDRFSFQPLPQSSEGWDWKFQPSNHMVGFLDHQFPSLGVVPKSPNFFVCLFLKVGFIKT